MRLERLLGILLYLLDSGQASAAELSKHFGTSERTIYRDMESLSLSGIPLVALPGAGGGYQLAERYTLDKSFLSPAELRSLVAVLGPLGRAAHDEALTLALGKLKAMSPHDDRDLPPAISVSPFPWGWEQRQPPHFKMIRQAIDERRLLRLGYSGISSREEGRVVEPYTLALGGQVWYLHAWCRLRSGFRLFRLSRIDSVEIMSERFDPHTRLPLPAPFVGSWGEDRMIEIVIRLGKESRLQVLDHFARNDVTELPSGSFEIRFSWSENENPIAYLMGFGGGLEVVSPPDLRRELAETAARLSSTNS